MRFQIGECGHPVKEDVDADPPHYKKTLCVECGKFLGWVAKPDAKKRRPNGSRRLAYVGYCQLCLRGPDEARAALEGHHVIEHQSGGSDKRDNLWTLCTGCHRFVHYIRTYHGRNTIKADE